MIIKEEVYLKHHGIKGQKWGLRNNQKLTKKGNYKLTSGDKVSIALTPKHAARTYILLKAIGNHKVHKMNKEPELSPLEKENQNKAWDTAMDASVKAWDKSNSMQVNHEKYEYDWKPTVTKMDHENAAKLHDQAAHLNDLVRDSDSDKTAANHREYAASHRSGKIIVW